MKTQLMFSSKTDEWETPKEFFDKLNQEFHFTLDVCADEKNHKCEKYFTKAQDGLKQEWGGNIVFCNPPYGREIGAWVKKCHEEAQKENTVCVMLLPARVDTKWFHEYIYDKTEIRFVKGRLKFGDGKNNAPFPSMVVIFRVVNNQDVVCSYTVHGTGSDVYRSADVVEVVRCKDCKHWRHETEERIEHYECNIFCGAYGRGYPTGADDFCSYGERKEV